MTNIEEEYITLFCEGDGGVYIDNKGYPEVVFYQKEREVLNYVDSLTEDGRLRPNKTNGVWRLVFFGSYCVPLLKMFSRHVVGSSFLERLNKVLEFVDMPLAVRHLLTIDGFVGFWDAEGGSCNAPSIIVGQKDREILDLIAEMFGGNVSRHNDKGGMWHHQWHLSGERAHALYEVIVEESHCPAKAEELRRHFEGPSYYELHKEERYAYYDTHRAEYKVRNKKRNDERKAIREWMKTHPEEVTKLIERY